MVESIYILNLADNIKKSLKQHISKYPLKISFGMLLSDLSLNLINWLYQIDFTIPRICQSWCVSARDQFVTYTSRSKKYQTLQNHKTITGQTRSSAGWYEFGVTNHKPIIQTIKSWVGSGRV